MFSVDRCDFQWKNEGFAPSFGISFRNGTKHDTGVRAALDLDSDERCVLVPSLALPWRRLGRREISGI